MGFCLRSAARMRMDSQTGTSNEIRERFLFMDDRYSTLKQGDWRGAAGSEQRVVQRVRLTAVPITQCIRSESLSAL